MVNYFRDLNFQERSDLMGLLASSLAEGSYVVHKYYHPKLDKEKFIIDKVSPLVFRAIRNDSEARDKLEERAYLFQRYIKFRAEKNSNPEINEMKTKINKKITKYNHAVLVTSFE